MIENMSKYLRHCLLTVILFIRKVIIAWTHIKITNIPTVFTIVVALLFACGSTAFAIKAYPNPWIPEGRNAEHGNLTDGITFAELPGVSGEICIYNIVGELMRRLIWEAGEKAIKWDGKDSNGEYVASGVYIWVIKDDNKSKISKIVVVR